MISYVEQCAQYVDVIRSGDVEALPIGPEIGRGTTYFTRSLGKVSVDDGDLHLAAKVPYRIGVPGITRLSDELRVFSEFADNSTVAERLPDLRERLPRFVGCVATENRMYSMLLTEDVSRNGSRGVREKKSMQDFEILRGAIADSGGALLRDAEHYMAFDVGDVDKQGNEIYTERIIDGTPSPFAIFPESAVLSHEESRKIVLEKLTITVPNDSKLIGRLFGR